MYRYPLYIALFVAVMLTGCRSDADQMAEFCLNFEAATHTDNCAVMAAQLQKAMAEPQPRLNNHSVCTKTTACLPCREAVRQILGLCGHDPVMRPVLDQMRFSDTLRQQMNAPEEDGAR